ncbi:hypothetical protein LBMAG52_45220 [Planctomycetia bacterium]|nr:hypothetical protein LBMAG52_45220 [Planctomycetia bacterium]
MRDASLIPAVTVKPANELSPLVVDVPTTCKLAGGVSDRHLRKFFPDGPAEYQPKLPVCRIGGRLLIRVTAIEAWLASIEQTANELRPAGANGEASVKHHVPVREVLR